jgi:hypothetical protein
VAAWGWRSWNVSCLNSDQFVQLKSARNVQSSAICWYSEIDARSGNVAVTGTGVSTSAPETLRRMFAFFGMRKSASPSPLCSIRDR